jgi:hypothetical protein
MAPYHSYSATGPIRRSRIAGGMKKRGRCLPVNTWCSVQRASRHPGSCEGDPALDAVHVDTLWSERVKEMAEVEGVSQTARVNRALRQSFEGDRSWIQAIV